MLFATVKVAELKRMHACQRRDQRLCDTFEAISELLDHKTCAELILAARLHLPKYLGYEYVGLLIFFEKSILLNLISKIANELCTCFTSHYMAGSKALLRFPSNNGISGTAFTEDKIITKCGEKLDKFSDLDNVGAFATIKDCVFIPLHGAENKKVGVLQVFNKKEGTIDKNEIKSLSNLDHALAKIVQNTQELNEALDFMVSAKLSTAKILQHTSGTLDSEHTVFFSNKITNNKI